ncbi:hypothetical protein FQA39_LY01970 [Lamprigera yunnana]|nr:hypothetical protein FQA39_LY01970 [Lamprigera yunnana]
MRSSGIVKKRGKASKVQRSWRIREFVIKSIQSDDNVPEDAHVRYFQNLPEENFPELNIQSSTSAEDTPTTLDGNRVVDINQFLSETKKFSTTNLPVQWEN